MRNASPFSPLADELKALTFVFADREREHLAHFGSTLAGTGNRRKRELLTGSEERIVSHAGTRPFNTEG